jgi:cellulose synthase/poly-beta-1,6-N-acetylglucosamine synthase-like glycosyltransferase
MGITEFISYAVLFILLYNQVFLLVTFFEKRSVNKIKHSLPKELPTVTIIVPCFNEQTTIQRTVESLLTLDYPKDKISLFLINDGSTDNTRSVLDGYASGYANIRVFHKVNEGKWRTLNYGLEYVTSEFVGCLDADSFVNPDALCEIISTFNAHPDAMAVTPSMRVWKPNTIVRRIQAAEYDLGIFVRKVFSFLGAIHITPGPFSIFKKKVFDIVGPYKHAHNTEDLEIALRMQKVGMIIENAHNAIVYTVAPASARLLYKQRVRWTGGFLKNLVDYRDMLFRRNYGHLSVAILPMTIVTVFASLYLIVVFVITTIAQLVKTLRDLNLVNFDFPAFKFKIDFFFMDTTAMVFIGMVLLITILTSVFIGRYITNNKKFFTLDVLCFILLYSFIAPFWLLTSVYNTLMSKETRWR